MKTKTYWPGVLGILLLFAVLIACKNPETKQLSTDKAEKALTQENPKSVPTDTIIIKGMRYQPDKLTVHKGDKVIWINKDVVVHDVTDVEDESQTSGNIEIGGRYELTVNEDLNYFCSIHPTMKASIIVKND